MNTSQPSQFIRKPAQHYKRKGDTTSAIQQTGEALGVFTTETVKENKQKKCWCSPLRLSCMGALLR